MATILYIWELGGGLGHLSRFRPIARELAGRGHKVYVASNQLASAGAVFDGEDVRYVQAPISHIGGRLGPKPPMNYTEILLTCGYADSKALTAFVTGWRELYELIDPSLIIADHSPTGLLAAHTMDIPRALIGTGFCSPPRVSPLPHLRPWLTLPPRRFTNGDKRVTAAMNEVLKTFDKEEFQQVADLFRYATEDFLLTFKEFDHYRWRRDAEYWGPLLSEGQGVAPEWPDAEGKKVFAYLKPAYANFKPVMTQLKNVGAPLLVYAGKLAPKVKQELGGPKIAFSEEPVDMLRAAKECDAAVCHGGHGTVAAMMLAGKPVVTPSMQLEQRILGSRIEDLGAGIMFKPGEGKRGVGRALKRVLEEDEFRAAAEGFAKGHRRWSNKKLLARICDRSEELAAA